MSILSAVTSTSSLRTTDTQLQPSLQTSLVCGPSGYLAASVCLLLFSLVSHHLLHFLHLLSGPDHGKSLLRSIVEYFSHSLLLSVFIWKPNIVPVGHFERCSHVFAHFLWTTVCVYPIITDVSRRVSALYSTVVHFFIYFFHELLFNSFPERKYPFSQFVLPSSEQEVRGQKACFISYTTCCFHHGSDL